MKKIIALSLVLVLALGVFSGCGGKNKEVLSLYTWGDMFPEEVLADFTKETGIEINYSTFDFDETMFAKLEADTKGVYDLVIADDYIIPSVVEAGLAQPLDLSKIPNSANVNPIYKGQFYDPADEYTIPYGAGVQTIVYDPSLVDIEINGYKDLLDPSLKDSIGIIGNYRVINGAALKILGESYNTEDVKKIEEAGAVLKELSPNIRLIKDDNLQNDLISGEVGAAIMYTSQVTLAKMARPDLKVVFPEEGIGFGIMLNFIPAKAPNPEAAYKFMDYILRPEVSAKCFEHNGYYTTNKASEDYVSAEFKDFIVLPEDLGKNIEILEPVSPEAEEAHSRVWSEFKVN